MKKSTNDLRHGRAHTCFGKRYLILAGFAAMVALCLASLALYTRTAATQGIETMPTLKGDSAVNYLKGKSDHDSLANAFKSIVDDDRPNSPEATVKLTANDGIERGYFGSSVAISGNTAIIGAPNLPEGNNGNIPGAAYIFIRNGASWTFQQKLTAPDAPPGNGNAFGDTVGISGDTVVVAAPQHDVPEQYSGGVYVFVRTGTTWTLQKRFTNADTPLVKGGKLGYTAAISGDTVLVTGFGFLEFSDDNDFVHVFVRDGTAWTLQTTLITGGDNSFGSRVAISGDTAVIGEPNASLTTQEAAYIYVRCGTEWTQQQRLTPGDGSAYKNFGGSVAISGNTVIVGADRDQLGTTNRFQGSAYIFVSDGTTWTQQQKLTADDGGTSSRFGSSVAILGDTAIVGKPTQFVLGTGSTSGTVLAYLRSGTTWALQETISPSDGQPSDEFGYSVAISSDTIVIGARLDDPGTAQTQHGSAYVIDRLTPPPPGGPENRSLGGQCTSDIEVNITTDQPDANLDDDYCDVNPQPGNQNECSLRAAIQTANDLAGPNLIAFNIPGGTAQTIRPSTNLPEITGPVNLFGGSQPGWNGTPVIEVERSSEGEATRGFVFAPGSEGSLMTNISITRFPVVGVSVETRDVSIASCYIGITPSGGAAGSAVDPSAGIAIFSDNTEIDVSVIGAYRTGVQLSSDATRSRIRRNKIGTDPNGANPRPNLVGIKVLTTAAGTSANRIEDNLISGNDFGVDLSGTASNNIITNNRFGTNLAETAPLPNAVGVRFAGTASLNRVTDNVIAGNTEAGVLLSEGSVSNEVLDNFIGVNRAETLRIENRFGALLVGGSRLNQIKRNVISGNTEDGIRFAEQANANVIAENQIGTNRAGSARIRNNQAGIRLQDFAAGNRIEFNLISGNEMFGVLLTDEASQNFILDNEIGTNKAGTLSIPNDIGVAANSEANLNEIKRNTISGNTASGIRISGLVSETLIIENRIGTNKAGNEALPNANGVVIQDEASEVGISRNLISGNNTNGVLILGEAISNIVADNKIGLAMDGLTAIGNENGVRVEGIAETNSVIGNTISGNTKGVMLTGNSVGTEVIGNRIGTNDLGSAAIDDGAFGVKGFGVHISGSSRGNIVSDNLVCNQVVGILVGTTLNSGIDPRPDFDDEAERSEAPSGAVYITQNSIRRNTIGLSAGRATPIPNAYGMGIGERARSNSFGSVNALYDDANLISGNTQAGIIMTANASSSDELLPQSNAVRKNVLGVSGDGLMNVVGNGGGGIAVLRAINNTLLDNIIVGNRGIGMTPGHGIILFDAEANRIDGNYIGTIPEGFVVTPNATGTLLENPLQIAGSYENLGSGIYVEAGSSANTIGGTTPESANVIANNGGNGITLASTAGSGNRIGTNRISGNALSGIDLGGNGLTVNDPTDADVGPNNLQNYPTLTLSLVDGDLIVSYQLDSAPANSVYGTSGIKVDFYEADAMGQGITLIGTDQYSASDYANGLPGTRQKNLGNAAALGVVAGDRLTATATDADGNSSEFTPAVALAGPPVTIGGRVTTPSGLGLRNAIVTLVEPGGVRRTATTSSFGIYSFANVASGQNYTISVASKRYRFAPRIQVISQSLNDLDFVGLE